MQYFVTINKKYQYVKVYNILKRINESTNPISKAFASFVDKLMTKGAK